MSRLLQCCTYSWRFTCCVTNTVLAQMNNCHNNKWLTILLWADTEHRAFSVTCGHFYLCQGICNWVASFINHVKRRNYLTETSGHLSQVTELLCDIKLYQPVETIESVSILLLPISITSHALSEVWHQPDGPDDVVNYSYHMLCIRSIVRHYGFMSNRPLSVYCRPPPAAQMVWTRNSKLTG